MLFVFISLCSCTINHLNYPYAENNTTIDVYYGCRISDDYQWLELNRADNEPRQKWLLEQTDLKNKFFKKKSEYLEGRLERLSEIPDTKTIGIINDTIYFFKLYYGENRADLCTYVKGHSYSTLIRSFRGEIFSHPRLQAAITAKGDEIAIVNRLPDEKNNILLYDLRTDSLHSPAIIHNVVNYSPVWIDKGFVYNEYTESGGTNVYYYNHTGATPAKKLIYQSSFDDSFVYVDLAYDRKEERLYISEYAALAEKFFRIYSVSGPGICQNQPVEAFSSLDVGPLQNIRMAGVDYENIYLVNYNNDIRGSVSALRKKNKACTMLVEDSLSPIATINLIKDHVVVSFQDMKANKAYIINNQTLEQKLLGIKETGRYTFLNNKSDSVLYVVEESITEPRTLCQVQISEPGEMELLSRIRNLPFDPDEYTTEHVTIESVSAQPINLILSYKKGLIRNGQNPTICYSFPNAGHDLMSPFSYARIFFMEQGFVLVQRNSSDYTQQFSIDQKTDELFRVVEYLNDAKYTNPQKLCLSGAELGSTVIANALNKKPDLCRSVVYTDGIFDLVRHQKLDYLQFENAHLFRFDNHAELNQLLSFSPYHNIQTKKSYPSMLLIVNDEKRISASHSFKYAARMQMRTKAKNPVILLPPSGAREGQKIFYRDLNNQYYKTLLFLSKTMNIDI